MSLSFPCLLSVLVFSPLVVQGTIVTTATDEDDGSLGGGSGISLREAVKYLSSGNTITFAPALSGQTIRLTLGEILIAESVTINGSALASRVTVSGDKIGNGKTPDDTNVFRIGADTIALDSLIIAGGSSLQGGGITCNRATANLTVKRCQFVGNSGTVVGGAIFFSKSSGAGTPTLTLADSTFIGNSAGNEGGAIYATYPIQIKSTTFTGNSARRGGAVFLQNNGSTSVFQDSSFNGNSAAKDGGAICLTWGSLHLQRSTVAGNTASENGGGIFSEGNFLYPRESTFSGNSALLDGGGIYTKSGYTTLRTCTIANNSAAGTGGGVRVLTSFESEDSTIADNTAAVCAGGLSCESAHLRNTIIAGNNAPSSSQFSGSLEGDFGNLITPILSLAPLGNYGGPTQTMPPIIGSPAIDPPVDSSYLTTDQRGFPRGSDADIGAVEYQEYDDAAVTTRHLHLFWADDSDQDGLPYGMERLYGSEPFLPDSAGTSALNVSTVDSSGHSILTFSIVDGPGIPEGNIAWKIMRSTGLHPGSFQEIFRYTKTGDSFAPGITAAYSPDPDDGGKRRITLTDSLSSEEGRRFYRFEAVLEPWFPHE